MNSYTEDALIEQPAIALVQQFSWEHMDHAHIKPEPGTRGFNVLPNRVF
jgi:hypothetical protein